MNIELLDFNNFGSSNRTWFHPAVAPLGDGKFFATMQKINGSDHYDTPRFAVSADRGESWSVPTEIPAFRSRRIVGTPFTEGVADIRPFAMQDGSVAVFGCTTFYTEKGSASWDARYNGKRPPGRAVYAVWSPTTGEWSERGTLELPGTELSFRTACTQAVLLERDRIILPIYLDSGVKCDYFGYQSSRFASLTAIYRKNGDAFEFVSRSNLLELPVLRGCIEPSSIRLPGGGLAMTLRAEDKKMYRALSDDALSWRDLQPWRWDDGTLIETDSTQQHWVRLGKKVFLVYTRRDGDNDGIMRFRAPLRIAEADAERAVLIRDSEKILFPRKNINGVEVMYGNFHCAQLREDCAIVTDSALYTERNGDTMSNTSTTVMAALLTSTEASKSNPAQLQLDEGIA